MKLTKWLKKRFCWFSLIAYLILSLLYIHPGEIPLLQRSTDTILSSGVDPTYFSYLNTFLIDRFKQHPTDLFFGAIHNTQLDAPDGIVIWDSLISRVEVLLLSLVLPVEQISTGLVVLNFFLNALVMFLLARVLNIPRLVSWGMGTAWAFSAYTRATAKVFMGLVGIYHLPLVFLGFMIIAQRKKFSAPYAALAFFIIVLQPHYYIIILALMTPLLIIFAFTIRPINWEKRKYAGLVTIVALPAILWLVFNLMAPLPSGAHPPVVFPKTGEVAAGHHPFLDKFAAYPWDYFAGDIGMGPNDPIALKEPINRYIIEVDYLGQHTHDRAVGIRWVLWLLAFVAALNLLPSSKEMWHGKDRQIALLFLAVGIVSFWFSLPPDWPFEKTGGSYWVYSLISQIRTPSRAGIGVGFSVILLSGLFLKNLLLRSDMKAWVKTCVGWAFCGLVVLELPPMYQDMPLDRVLPRFPALSHRAQCGIGMHYPYISLHDESQLFLVFLQRMRGTNCGIINRTVNTPFNQQMRKTFSWNGQGESDLQRLKDFAACVPLDWVAFGAPIQNSEAIKICHFLSWSWQGEGICVAKTPSRKSQHNPQACLDHLLLREPKS